MKNSVSKMITKAKRTFFLSKFENVKTCKELFDVSSELLGSQNKTILLPGTDRDLCSSFSDFFSKKITSIRQELDKMCAIAPNYNQFKGLVIDYFIPATEEEIKKIILDSPSKSCALDPMPTSLLKKCLHELLPHITQIVNDSLLTGTVPN